MPTRVHTEHTERFTCALAAALTVSNMKTLSLPLCTTYTLSSGYRREGEGERGRGGGEEDGDDVANVHDESQFTPAAPYLSWSEEECSSRKKLCFHVLTQLHKQRFLKVAKHPTYTHTHACTDMISHCVEPCCPCGGAVLL